MKMFLRDWDALLSPHEPVTALKAWRWLLRAEGGAGESQDTSAAVTCSDAEAFLLIVDEVVMPKLVAAGANWMPKNAESTKLTRLYEAWEPVLPSDAMQQLLHTLVLPKLKAEVDGWNPRVDHVPIHSWLHLWLPLAANDMEELYPVIRYKIGMALSEWHPSDSSALNILKPWAGVFKEQHMDALLARCVLPKLALTLRELPINPANQNLDPFHWVFKLNLN